ncbi:MAG TPA: HEAT repeat domain-containing protein [Bdellovibrio sp.]|nr:HEAT repeat domain-containing protein [Bdellovibrio sp.]
MNKKMTLPLLLTIFSSSVFAALPKPSPSTMTSAMEIIKLPAENRRAALEGQGDKFYSSFVEIAFNNTETMNVRWRAVMAAAEAGGEKATADLLKAGEHDQWYMRNAALVALAEVNPAQSQKLAQKLLKDKALVVRSAAVEALDSSEKKLSPEVRDLLWDELNQDYNFKGGQSLWIRHQIVEVLAKRPQNNELGIFADLLSDKDTRVRLPAVGGLEKLTGVKLGEEELKQSDLVKLWKDYIRKEKLL